MRKSGILKSSENFLLPGREKHDKLVRLKFIYNCVQLPCSFMVTTRTLGSTLYGELGHINYSFHTGIINNRLLNYKIHEVCDLVSLLSSKRLSTKQLFITYLMNVRMNE